LTPKWEYIWTYEEVGDNDWGIINETSTTGHMVLHGLGEKSAKFYSELMNEVYNQVKRDLKEMQDDSN
jgi:hypothetical protein